MGPSSSLSHDRRRGRAWPRLLLWPANPLRHSSPKCAGPPHHRCCRVSRPCLIKSQRGRRKRRRPRRRRRASVEREEVKRRERDLREPTALRTDSSHNRPLSEPILSWPANPLRVRPFVGRSSSPFSAHRSAQFSAPHVPCPH